MSRNEKQTCNDLINPALDTAGWKWDREVLIGTCRLKTDDWIDLPIPDVGDRQLEIVNRLERFRGAPHELLSAQSQLDTSALRNAILRQAFAGEL
ncbi:hypothetical protein OAK43_03150 [Verrucomicrobiales bacterium]|nr:hypothetical protein [Verrucomicrobiales bacterium]